MTGPTIVRAAAAWVMTLSGALASAAPPADPFASCRTLFAQNPQDYDASYCFYQVAASQRLWDDGARVFDELARKQPANFWVPLAHGHLYRSRDAARAESLYRQSADGFKRIRNAEGEILARSNLRDFLFPKGRVAEATREMERVVAIAGTVDDPLLKARAWSLQATHVQDTGGDLSFAYQLLKQTETAIFPGGPYRLQRTLLTSLGQVAFRLGRLDEALGIYHRLDQLAAAQGEERVRASAQYNILNTSSLKESVLPTRGGKQRLIAQAEQALTTATASDSLEVALRTHRALAELIASDSGSRATALAHVERCLELAMKVQLPHDQASCSWVQASLLRAIDPERSKAAEIRAVAAAARANSPRTDAYSAGRRMRLSWDTRPRPDAIRDGLAAIDAVERLRTLQDDSEGGAELFSTWTSDYYWLAGRLLEESQAGDLELAFSITERMRARALLDAVKFSGPAPILPTVAVEDETRLREDIAALHRRLINPAVTGSDRQTALSTLAALERQVRRPDQQPGQISAAAPSPRRPAAAFADLAAIQATLGNDEALLSFQVGLWTTYDGQFGGGSWLVAVTRNRRSVYRLPDRAQLAPRVPIFAGLLAGTGGMELVPAVRLYDDLLSQALRELPAGITRLILVPDSVLHHLPFDALRASRDGPPLGTSYQLVVAPSATLWRHWRGDVPRATTHRVLTLADPELEVGVEGDAADRGATLQQGRRLGRLPYARRESRSLARHLGGVESLLGANASERALKERDLQRYDILHLAAHAIADEAHPARSAVLLSAGAGSEDGRLQAREISQLHLDGAIVVLSACRTVSGAVLSGEGVLSLARAFFEAGAHAVIGSRWPIRDRDAASFFDVFYRVLGQGASLAEALTRAKAESIAAGKPAAAWAGIVLLGDGAIRPFPGGRPPAAPARWPFAVLGAAIVLVIGVKALRITRPSPSSLAGFWIVRRR